MNRFQNILFVADKSKGELAALTQILVLAARTGAKVTVMDVVAALSDRPYTADVDVDLCNRYKHLVRERQQELDCLAKTAASRAGSALPRLLLREGSDHIEIICQASSSKHDLVAKASAGNEVLTDALQNMLDMRLLRNCPCPVFIIKPHRKTLHARVLAAVDLDDASPQPCKLDKMVLEVAASMAKMTESRLDLLHVWHLPYEKKSQNEDRLDNIKMVDTKSRELCGQKQDKLAELTKKWSGLQPQAHLVRGFAQIVIPRFVRNESIDLVVMGNVGHSGIGGFFVGNTAEKTLYELNCSILAIKPIDCAALAE